MAETATIPKPKPPTKTAIKRVIQSARECGLVVESVKVGADGSIQTLPRTLERGPMSPEDILAEFEAQHGDGGEA